MPDRSLYLKRWYQQNRSRVLAQQQEYYRNNKPTKLQKCKLYRQQNKDKQLRYSRNHRLRNIDRVREYQRVWHNRRYQRKYATNEERYKAHSLLLQRTFLGENNPFYGKTHSDEVKAKRLLQVIPIKDTSIEVALQNALKEKGIEFEKHKPIFGQPDIFIEPNICIFADGDYWHNLEKSKKRDAEVNITLQLMGYKVIRLWEHDIKKRLGWCICQALGPTTSSPKY